MNLLKESIRQKHLKNLDMDDFKQLKKRKNLMKNKISILKIKFLRKTMLISQSQQSHEKKSKVTIHQ